MNSLSDCQDGTVSERGEGGEELHRGAHGEVVWPLAPGSSGS